MKMKSLRFGIIAACVLTLPACAARQRTYTLDVTGSGQALTRVTSETVGEFRPALSPDGSTLLMDVVAGDEYTIVGVDPTTGGRRTLFTSANSSSMESSWLPDGSGFVYTTNSTGAFSLVRTLSRTPNAAVTVVLPGEVAPRISTPAVSPNGQRIAFATDMRGTWNVGTVGIGGDNFTLIGQGYDPAYSPDGTRLVFQRAVNGYVHLFSADAATGSDLVQITSGDHDNIGPMYSPDGNYIVFASNRGGRRARIQAGRTDVDLTGADRGEYNLYALRPDGTGLVQITDGDARAIQPFWAPDGWIYFSTNQAGDFDLWRLRPAGQLTQ